MNIKWTKPKNKSNAVLLILSAMVLSLILLSVHFLIRSSAIERQLANEIQEANPDWTRGQKLKWALTKQFQIKIERPLITLSHSMAPQLCEQNHGLRIQLAAFEVMIAGRNPTIDILVACDRWLQATEFKLQIDFVNLRQLQSQKSAEIGIYQAKSFGLYADEEWPTDWMINEIEIVGPDGFTINRFELQESLKQVFSLKIE